MPNIIAESVSVTLTGATATALTCASTTGLYVGQRGWAVKSDITGNTEVIVVSVISGTQFLCQTLANINNGGGADLSAYDGGTFYFEKQLVEIPGAGADTGSLDALAVGAVPAKQSDGTFAAATLANVPDSATRLAMTTTERTRLAGVQSILNYNVASRTLTISDIDAFARDNYATTISVTLPSDAAVTIPIGSSGIVEAVGVGQVTFVADSGVTINSFLSYKSTAATYCPAMWCKTAANTYNIVGRLAP